MKITRFIFTILLIINSFGCQGGQTNMHNDQEAKKGPHGGMYFEQNGFGLEATIYEKNVPPQSRVYLYYNQVPLDPSLVNLTMSLHRIDRVDIIDYKTQKDYLIGDKIIEEPHSFQVKFKAIYQGVTYAWDYDSYEGRTQLTAETIQENGISIEKTQGAEIRSSINLYGKVVPKASQVSAITARFPGVVANLHINPGDSVKKNDLIATIEANESLKTYQIKAPMAGEVVAIQTSIGQQVASDKPFVMLADLSSVWVEMFATKKDFASLQIDQEVVLAKDSLSPGLVGKIVYLSSFADADTQARLVRAEFPNHNLQLSPELFVDAQVIVDKRRVPVAIKANALQKYRDWDVVFRKLGDIFEIVILKLGERDGEWIEVQEGIEPGVEYVTENSFVVKADVMKAGASHDH